MEAVRRCKEPMLPLLIFMLRPVFFAAFLGDLIISRSVIGPSLNFYFAAHPGTAVTPVFTFFRTPSLCESYLTFITCRTFFLLR